MIASDWISVVVVPPVVTSSAGTWPKASLPEAFIAPNSSRLAKRARLSLKCRRTRLELSCRAAESTQTRKVSPTLSTMDLPPTSRTSPRAAADSSLVRVGPCST